MTQARIPVVIAAADIESGVTSWALRFRDYCRDDGELDVSVVNCWRTQKQVGRFDAEITTIASMRRYLMARPGCVVVPNFVWELFPLCAQLASRGADVCSIGYARSDSEAEYYAPLAWLEPVIGAFLASSTECAEELRRRLPHRASEIEAAPSGVLVPKSLSRNWQVDPIRLIYAGRLVQEQKRIMDFVPLVSELISRAVPFTLDIIGSGREAGSLRTALDELPHGGRVRVQPPVPASSMPAIWASHDVFVQLSEYEGTSSSMLEAMSQGCVPIVTEASSGIRGVITPGLTGYVLPVGDMKGIAREIALLQSNQVALESMGRRVHEASKQYDLSHYRSIFLRAVQRTRSAPPRIWPMGDASLRHALVEWPVDCPLVSRKRFLAPSLSDKLHAMLGR